jgi:hypothetical protein
MILRASLSSGALGLLQSTESGDISAHLWNGVQEGIGAGVGVYAFDKIAKGLYHGYRGNNNLGHNAFESGVETFTQPSFLPGYNQVQSFSVKSALDGKLYPKESFPALVNYLEKRGVHVYGTEGPPFFCGKPNGVNQIYLPENPTILQVKHELSHWLDFRKLGFEEYAKLPVYQREKMVLERLQQNRMWNNLNEFEKKFSINYVEKIKSGYKPGARDD